MIILGFFVSFLTFATLILSFLYAKYVKKRKRAFIFLNMFAGVFAGYILSLLIPIENSQAFAGILGLIAGDIFTLEYVYKAYKKAQNEEAEPLSYKEHIETIQREKKENKKRIISGLVVAFVLTGIPFVSVAINHNKYKDTNGANNYNLQHITDEQILNNTIGVTKNNYSFHSSGEKTGFNNFSDFDYKRRKVSAEKLSGIELIQATKVNTKNIELTAETKVECGNFRLAVVIDKEIYDDFKINTKDTIKIKNCKGKDILVYIVGENAKFEATIERNLYNSKKAFD